MNTCTPAKNPKCWNTVVQQYSFPVNPVDHSTASPSGPRPLHRKRMLTIGIGCCLLSLPVASLKQLAQLLPSEVTVLAKPPGSLSATSPASPEYTAPRYEIISRSITLPRLKRVGYLHKERQELSRWSDHWETHIVPETNKYHRFLEKILGQALLRALLSDDAISTHIQHAPPGSILRIERIKDTVQKLIIYQPGQDKSYLIKRRDNHYEGRFVPRLIETHQHRALITINHSFRYDANNSHLPAPITRQLYQVFKRDAQLIHQLRKGDQVTLIYETYYHKTSDIAYGFILAAEIIHKQRSYRAIRYVNHAGKAGYYNPEGYDLELAFRRHPIKRYKRISSRFGMRSHPIKKRLIKHLGTDYAAPRGTPVFATGTGTVRHASRKGGYGNAVIIDHQGGYQTLYGHLSRIKASLRPGKTVYQGDIIGYVGSTGHSTGPHLHYEFRKNGKPYNSLSVKLPHARSLPASEVAAFKEYAVMLNRQLNILQRLARLDIKIDSNTGG